MSEITGGPKSFSWLRVALSLGLCGGLAGLLVAPHLVWATTEFVVLGLVEVAPLVIPGILLAAWVSASGAGDRIAETFNDRMHRSVIIASLIGALTPVCGVTVLPLMAGLLASGVPLAPVMAFWLSSPVTDPAMLATTAATLGLGFALGKTAAAIGLGLLGGFATAALTGSSWTRRPLRSNRIVGKLSQPDCRGSGNMTFAIWRTRERRTHFWREAKATIRLILICLIPAFAAEYWLSEMLHPEALSVYVGKDAWWAVPLAVFVGAPAYLDGYAALPLTRALIDHGMSEGAAMSFLVSGGVVSIWGAMAIFPVLRLKPFLLYLALALVGSMAAGWAFEAISSLPSA
ncbi:MAG: permease [Kiloniellales bacterium]|nr:permease [Kiloniellales bacterium]